MIQRVLLVDDDQDLIDGLRRVLRKEPYEISHANSAQQALDLMQTVPFDVIVTDEQMPGMLGTELLRTVRERHPRTMTIMLTGKASLEVALQAINEGETYRLLTKPCNEVELFLAIREALQQRELISQSRKLIDAMRLQAKYIDALESETPGITKIVRDDSGAIIMRNDLSIDDAIRQVTEELDKAEQRFSKSKKLS